MRHHLLRERAARSFGKQRLLRVQFHAALKIRRRLAILADAHIARCHTFYAAIGVKQQFRCRKARVNFHAQAFRLLRQPAAKLPQADDVVALVVKIGGNRQPESAFGG